VRGGAQRGGRAIVRPVERINLIVGDG